jgi:hypothetical protein
MGRVKRRLREVADKVGVFSLWPKKGEIMIRKEMVQKFCEEISKPTDLDHQDDKMPAWVKALNKDVLEYFSSLDKKTIDKVLEEGIEAIPKSIYES